MSNDVTPDGVGDRAREGASCCCTHYVVDYSDPERYHPENMDREGDPRCPVHGEAREGASEDAMWALRTPSVWESPDARSIPVLLAAIGQVLADPERILADRLADAKAEVLAEVERRIEAWIRHGEAVPADCTTYERWIVHDELRRIIPDYRSQVTP